MTQDSSFYEAWSQELKRDIWQLSEDLITTWCDIVAKTGVDDNIRDQWSATFKEQVESVYKDMIDDAVFQQNRLVGKIEALLKRAEVLCKELHIKMPDFGSDGLCLSKEYTILATRIQEYEDLLETRKREIEKLVKQQQKLCQLLGKEPKIIPESPLPTDELLNEVRNYIEQLENEKFARYEIFLEMKAAIIDIVEELGYTPNLDFENMVLSNDDSTFTLTDSNMDQLKDFLSRLQHLQDSTSEELGALRERMTFLWGLLDVDVKTYTEFLQKNSGRRLSTVKVFKEEVKRLEVLRRANMEEFVKSLRIKLEMLWNQCHFTAEQRAEFEYFHADLYTEDLATLHDLEIQKLKHYYDKNKELFNLLEKRHEMWNKLCQLEERGGAPDRYKNRGGQLLKEEKERNVLSKRIPVIEQRLCQLADEYEQSVGKPFTSWGETVRDIIEHDYKMRDEEKLLKSSARKRDKTVTPGKSTLTLSRAVSHQNLLPVCCDNTPLKRKMFQTPEIPPKKTKVLTSNSNATKTAPPKIRLNLKSTNQQTRSSLERLKIKKKYRRISQTLRKKEEKENENVTFSEYDNFEQDIANKENCRSTLFGETTELNFDIPQIDVIPATPVKLKTPLKQTPQGNPKELGTPRTASKFSVAPPLKLLF